MTPPITTPPGLGTGFNPVTFHNNRYGKLRPGPMATGSLWGLKPLLRRHLVIFDLFAAFAADASVCRLTGRPCMQV